MVVDAVMTVYGTVVPAGAEPPEVTGAGPSVTVVGMALTQFGQMPAK